MSNYESEYHPDNAIFGGYGAFEPAEDDVIDWNEHNAEAQAFFDARYDEDDWVSEDLMDLYADNDTDMEG